MSTKIIAARFPNSIETPPLAKHLRNALLWLIRRASPAAARAERTLAIEERVSIGPKKSLVVVRCHGQRFLIATAGDTVGPFIEIAQPKAARRARREREA